MHGDYSTAPRIAPTKPLALRRARSRPTNQPHCGALLPSAKSGADPIMTGLAPTVNILESDDVQEGA